MVNQVAISLDKEVLGNSLESHKRRAKQLGHTLMEALSRKLTENPVCRLLANSSQPPRRRERAFRSSQTDSPSCSGEWHEINQIPQR